jgi:hypothetical protein
MSQNSEETSGISQSDMQLFIRTMQNMGEQLKKAFEDLRESLREVHESMEQSAERLSDKIEIATQEMRHIELNICEEKEIEVDEEEQVKINDSHQGEASGKTPEQASENERTECNEQADENSETRAVNSRRRGEREAPDEQDIGEGEMPEIKLKSGRGQIDHKTLKMKQRLKKGITKVGACRKKKWELLRKNMHDKSSKEAFQAWIDQVRMKHHEQTNNVGRHQTTRQQRHVPWDPGGFISKNRSSQVPDHRSQSPSLIATSALRTRLRTSTPVRDYIPESPRV